jgi:hypothetical protein
MTETDTPARILPPAPWNRGVKRIGAVEVDGAAFELFDKVVEDGQGGGVGGGGPDGGGLARVSGTLGKKLG